MYEPPREIVEDREKKMAQKMVKTIDGIIASDEKKLKVKSLYL